MNRYQEALNNIKNMGDKDLYNERHLKWAETLQQLVDKANKYDDKETPKQTKTEMNEHNHIDRLCPICDSLVYSFDKYCYKCGQRIRSDE